MTQNPVQVSFAKDSEETFLKELRQEVNAYFAEQKIDRYGGPKAQGKALGLLAGFFLAYGGIISAGDSLSQYLICSFLLGPLSVFTALNIGHDAAHNCFSRRKWANQLGLQVFSLFGVSGYMWKQRHVHTHHIFPNIPGWDQDIGQSEIARIHPEIPLRAFHRWQHIYMLLLYFIYTLHWFLIRDFKDFQVLRFGNRTLNEHPKRAFWGMIFTKGLFLGAMMGLPLWLTDLTWGWILFGFLLTEMMASLFVTFVLVAAHVGEGAAFPVPDANGHIPHSWAMHQVLTTTDFATQNGMITHLYGGFNHHLVHHLFPQVSHIHYPMLTRLVQRKLAEHQIPYLHHPTLKGALAAHYRHLVQLGKNGKRPSLYELEL